MVEKPPHLYLHVMRRELISRTYGMLFLKGFSKYETSYLGSFVPLKTLPKPWDMPQSEDGEGRCFDLIMKDSWE